MKTKSRAWNGWTAGRRDILKADVVDRARQELAKECPSAYYFNNLHLDYRHGVLTVSGTVPTYALRSVLDTILAHVEGVEQVDNQVCVISSTGLSSVHPK